MIRYLLPLFVFLLFLIEGTVVQVFSPERFGSDVIFVPRFIMVAIVFISIFVGRSYGTFYGIAFGFLYDLIYTDLIGVYLFSMGLVGYMMSFTFVVLRRSLILLILLALIGVTILDFFVFGLYSIIGIANMTQQMFIHERLIPGLIFNGVFAIIIAFPLRKFLLYLQVVKRREQQQEEN